MGGAVMYGANAWATVPWAVASAASAANRGTVTLTATRQNTVTLTATRQNTVTLTATKIGSVTITGGQ